MPIRISNSAKDRFQSCPRKYYYHYLERLRSPKIGSALFFGNALDDAFSRLLLEKKVIDLSEPEKELMKFSAEELFSQKMLEAKNDAGETVKLPKSNLADYYSSDFSPELFTPEIVALVSEMDKSYNNVPKIVKFHENCKYNLNFKNKDRVRLKDDEFILYNYINWLSLNEKGQLMLEAYKRDIIPKIAKVYDIQKEISIKSDVGDEIVGKIDLIASFTSKPDTKVICDNKTSATPYAADSVRRSEQLATYAEAEQTFDAAYLVVQKKVFKKAPVIRTQIIADKIDEEILKKTFDIYSNLCENVSSAGSDINNYPKNESSCFAFGKVCPYYTLCKHNSIGNLINCKKPETTNEE